MVVNCVYMNGFLAQAREGNTHAWAVVAQSVSKTGHAGRQKSNHGPSVIVSRPYVPATSANQSNSQTRVLWGEMFNVYSWLDGDFFTKTLGISLGFSKQLGMQSS